MDFQEQLAEVSGEDEQGLDEGFAARSRRDPGTPGAAVLATATILVFYLLVVGSQFLPAPSPSSGEAQASEWTEEDRDLRFEQTRQDQVAAITRALMYASEQVSVPEDLIAQQIPESGDDPMGRIQRIVMTGELVGADAALAAIDEIEKLSMSELSLGDGALTLQESQVLEYLRGIYDGSLDPSSVDVDLAAAADYLGWWGTLARVHDAPAEDPERSDMLQAGERLFGFMLALLGGAAVVLLAVIASVVYMVLRMSKGQLRSSLVPPAPGGSVYLEVFAVFLVGFLLVQILAGLVGAGGNVEAATWAGLVGQWTLIVVPLWPLVRGVSFERLRQDIGWHSGKGVVREIGAGIVGYLAGLPLFIAAILLVFVMQIAIQASGSGPIQPNNPILDLVQKDNALLIAFTVSLAVLWAPFVEETVFRGALLRHMRGRMGIAAGALLTGILFAFLHSYGPLFTPPLIALGITFAMLREWRGSLIAPMTAHFLHNGTLMLVILTAMNAAA